IIVWMERMGLEDDEPIEHRWITRSIENAQKKVEGHNFNIRKNLLEYDDVLNQQRQAVYERRRKALLGENIREMVVESIENLVDDIMEECAPVGLHPEDWKVEEIFKQLARIFGIEWTTPDAEIRDLSYDELCARMLDEAIALYEAKEEEVGEEALRQVERMLLLQFTDQFWKDHLLAMDRLRDGIGLRGYGQRNPLLEYKREGFNMFALMGAMRDEAVVSRLLRLQLAPAEDQSIEVNKAAARRLASTGQLRSQVPQVAAPAPPVVRRPSQGEEARTFGQEKGVRRNEPCPCGSGRKFKKCCGSPAQPAA
ncbi:MAG: SEC-C metal-binding domain-containing protein, partial [Myxococcota bacterium]|nr:SEC-C metal-binding domain-containing protein [Myxococcota bacterium]